jgi:cellulose synthase/poly-beta-1,6-N-acetylglucosamine synthase-like glycosyltransferase
MLQLEPLLRLVFWVSLMATLYTYAGYPLLLGLIATIFRRPVQRGATEPKVSIIIAAFNEEKDIAFKLDNTLAIDYPVEKLEIIVVSDCSSDRTDEIVSSYESRGVRLIRQQKRQGKTAAQNLAVEHSKGEVLLFSDATTIYPSDVLERLLPSFADSSVGCVAGRLVYVDETGSTVGQGARTYWNYETFIKERESAITSLIGVSGCLYAVRRASYVPMYHEACSDFLIATTVVKQNQRAVFEPSAVCTETTNSQSKPEFRMRVRIIAQTLGDLWDNREMLNPFVSGFYGIQLFSHKVLRYCIPIFLLFTFLSSLWLSLHSVFFLVAMLVQAGLYGSGLLALILENLGVRLGPLSLPLYFCLANAASAAAIFQLIKGERYASWEPIRGGNLDKAPFAIASRIRGDG